MGTTFGQAPAITSANASTFLAGSLGSFTVTATGVPAPTIALSGALPNGLSFSSPTISGTPTPGTGGSYPLVLSATNGCSNASQNFTLTVNQAPAITSANATTFTVGTPGSFTVTATGYPAPTLGMTGTPPVGVTFAALSGVLSGTPAPGSVAGYPLTYTAANGVGTPASQAFTLTVQKASTTTSISSELPDPSVVGQPVTVNFSVAVVAPATGIPSGSVTVGDGVDSCSATVAVGTCTLTLHTSGMRTLTASYPGDASFEASQGTVQHQVLDQSDLQLTSSAVPAVLPPNGGFTHIFTMTNLGPSPDTAVSLAISLPPGATVSSIVPSPACSNAGNTVTCTIGDLASAGAFTARINLTASVSGLYASTGVVTGAIVDPVPGNNNATATTTMGQILASPSPVVLRAEIGTTTSGSLAVTNDSPLAVGFSVLERNWRPITAPQQRPAQPATRRRPAGLERSTDARGIEKLAPEPNVPLDPSAGTVLASFSTGLTSPFGLGLDVRTGDFWVSNPAVGGGDDKDYRFLSDGTPTGDTIDTSSWVNFAALDMTYDPYSNKLWQTNYNEGCIYELDPVAMVSTGAKICPATAAAPIGLAYDPVSDTFLAGSWDDGVINRFDRSGTVLDSVNVGLNISGLAYNPSTRHLFVLVNDATAADVYVLDADDSFRVIRSFAIAGLGDYQQGGLEIDCAGNLWAVNQVSGEVLEVASGETGSCDYLNVPWLEVSPTTGTIPANASQALTLDATTAGQLPGLHLAQLYVGGVDPFPPLNVPVCFTAAFHDVPAGSFAEAFIHAVAGAGVSYGCGDGNFCPNDVMTRGTMARWMELARHGSGYTVPRCVGIFADVPCETTPNADYIEAFYNEGITAGCGTNPLWYCPNDPVSRAQMAVFIMSSWKGPSYVPPPCVGIFNDVPCPGGFAVDWIEDLYNHGITAGCGNGNFCPDGITSRAEESVFVEGAWSIPMCSAPDSAVRKTGITSAVTK